MPRAKKNLESENVKKKSRKIVSKKSSKKHFPEKTAKKYISKTKSKPVIIDVIEDEDDKIFPDLPSYLANSDLEENDNNDFVSGSDAIDQQKKFFSELVSEMKQPEVKKKKEEVAPVIPSRSVSLYKRLAWQFLLVISALLVIVFYFAFFKLTITISPNGETITDTMLVKISSASSSKETSGDFREIISGNAREINLNEEKTYEASGEEFVGEEIFGVVKLINTTTKSQALVATTRLLSPDNKLYRLKEAVIVPAGGEVEAAIYVDKPTEDLAIGPTTFTIPGLWVGLQDKIYAKNTDPFIYRQKISRYVKASDIEKAISEMNAILLAKARSEEMSSSKNTEFLYEFLTPTKFDYNVKPGEVKDSFILRASSTLLAISFSREDISRLVDAKLKLLVPDDKKLVNNGTNDIIYKLENYDIETSEVTLKLNFGGTMILASDANLIDPKKLVNLSQGQIENFLKNFSEIKSYELDFRPKFIKRAPRLPERISIEIKGLEK